MVLDHFQTFVFILVHLGSLEVVFNAICGLDGWVPNRVRWDWVGWDGIGLDGMAIIGHRYS